MDCNFISEIISQHSETEIKYLNDSIQNVSEKISLLKMNVKEKMEKRYVEFIPIVVENETFLEESSVLIEDIKELQTRLDTQTKKDIEDLSEELVSLKESLIESSTVVDIVFKLSKINLILKECNGLAKLKKYYETSKHINEASQYLNEECKDLQFLDIYKGLTSQIVYYKDQYCREAVTQWRKCIVWTRLSGDLKNEKSRFSLSVSAEKSVFENLIKTLEMYDVSDKEMASFSENLLKQFLIPLIKMDCVLNVKNNGLCVKELIIFCSSDSEKPSYKKVLENLTNVFHFVDQVIGINLHTCSFLECVGQYIAEEFLTLLIEECLTDAIPYKREHLKNYAPTIEPITNFQSFLITIGFLPESDKTLELYFGNAESLFLNKTIEKHTDVARSLMKRDLHELIEVGELNTEDAVTTFLEKNPVKIEQTVTKSITADTLPVEIDKLCPNLFKFPSCSVSKSVRELLDLVNEILNESLESGSKSYTKLFILARNIISMYPEIVPMYHAKILRDIPQCSAILYNNLIYLAHNVLTIDFDKRFLSTRLHSSSIPEMSCFTDLILPLRKEANKVLSLQIQRQQKVLFSFLKDSGLSALSEYEKLPDSVEKSIRGCLIHLRHLKGVWQDVLPANVYAQVIGGLCTVIVGEITNRIVVISDIRADIATSLVKVLSQIQTDAPRLFPDVNDVYIHVKSWSKLKELVIILGASLAEISERWADGKGPLAVEFSSEQVRQMIKALFQVSERRAAVLARIK